MPADAGITIHESRLLRTFGAPAIVGQHSQSALSRSLLIPACPSDTREFAHASMAHSRLPSGTFIVNDLKAAFYDHGKIMINAVPSLCSPIHL